MVLATPEIIKQAVAGSHFAVWRQQAFTSSGMLVFTVLIGFFGLMGLHHVMLRSPMTALLFFMFNAVTWNYWYFFDILQLAYTDIEDLNEYGLGSPFLFEFGVAVGMWKDENKVYSTPAQVETQKGGYRQRGGASAPAPAAAAAASTATPADPTPAHGPSPAKSEATLADRIADFTKRLLTMVLGIFAKPPPEGQMITDPTKGIDDPLTHSFWVFLFILFAPIGVVGSLIAGDNVSALLHILDPLMIVTFVFNSIGVLLNPIDIFMGGVYRPLFYRILNFGFERRGQSSFLQMAKIPSSTELTDFVNPIVDTAREGGGILKEIAGFIPLVGIGEAAKAGKDAAGAMVTTAKAGAAATQASVAKIEAEAEETRARAALLKAQAAQLQGGTVAVKAAAAPGPEASVGKPDVPVQKGGFVQRGSSNSDTISIGILGAVLVGGLLLGVVRSNVFQGKDDSPPVARTVRGPKGF